MGMYVHKGIIILSILLKRTKPHDNSLCVSCKIV